MASISYFPLPASKRIEGMSYTDKFMVIVGQEESRLVMLRQSFPSAAQYKLGFAKQEDGQAIVYDIQDAAFTNITELEEYVQSFIHRHYKVKENARIGKLQIVKV